MQHFIMLLKTTEICSGNRLFSVTLAGDVKSTIIIRSVFHRREHINLLNNVLCNLDQLEGQSKHKVPHCYQVPTVPLCLQFLLFSNDKLQSKMVSDRLRI